MQQYKTETLHFYEPKKLDEYQIVAHSIKVYVNKDITWKGEVHLSEI